MVLNLVYVRFTMRVHARHGEWIYPPLAKSVWRALFPVATVRMSIALLQLNSRVRACIVDMFWRRLPAGLGAGVASHEDADGRTGPC